MNARRGFGIQFPILVNWHVHSMWALYAMGIVSWALWHGDSCRFILVSLSMVFRSKYRYKLCASKWVIFLYSRKYSVDKERWPIDQSTHVVVLDKQRHCSPSWLLKCFINTSPLETRDPYEKFKTIICSLYIHSSISNERTFLQGFTSKS